MKAILLTQGKVAIVDDEDFDWLSQWKWCAANFNGYWYAVRGHGSLMFMHRVILNPPEGYQCDHINGDGLDNRRANLRVCDCSQNAQNQISQTGTSRFKGVSWHKPRGLWQVHIKANDKSINLGYFTSEVEAAKTYNKAAIKYFGEFAYLNNIGGLH